MHVCSAAARLAVVVRSDAMTSSSNDTFPLINPTEHLAASSDLASSDLAPAAMLRSPPPPPPAISGRYSFDYVVYREDLSGVATPWSEDRAFVPATTVYSLTFVLGILGNGFVILALLSGWRVGRTNEGSCCCCCCWICQTLG